MAWSPLDGPLSTRRPSARPKRGRTSHPFFFIFFYSGCAAPAGVRVWWCCFHWALSLFPVRVVTYSPYLETHTTALHFDFVHSLLFPSSPIVCIFLLRLGFVSRLSTCEQHDQPKQGRPRASPSNTSIPPLLHHLQPSSCSVSCAATFDSTALSSPSCLFLSLFSLCCRFLAPPDRPVSRSPAAFLFYLWVTFLAETAAPERHGRTQRGLGTASYPAHEQTKLVAPRVPILI